MRVIARLFATLVSVTIAAAGCGTWAAWVPGWRASACSGFCEIGCPRWTCRRSPGQLSRNCAALDLAGVGVSGQVCHGEVSRRSLVAGQRCRAVPRDAVDVDRLDSGLQHDGGDHLFAVHGIGQSHDRCFADRRVTHQNRLHLGR